MVKLADPPPSRTPRPRHAGIRQGTRLTRIYNRDFLSASQYNHNGPRARFDHHAEVAVPATDPLHGIYYAADDLAGCVVEVFGDSGIIEPKNYGVALVEVPRDLRLLDLNEDGAWQAGSVAALTQDGDRVITQRWARHFYVDEKTYGPVDGLRFQNAHNNAQAYALFERAKALTIISDQALSDPALESALFAIADRLNLAFFGA